MLKPFSWIASHIKVLPSDDGVVGFARNNLAPKKGHFLATVK